MIRRFARRSVSAAGYGLGVLICEPKVRLGRRRHDGICDRCDDPIDRYAMEKLDFPGESPDIGSPLERIRRMLNAEYVRVCLECSAEMEAEEVDDGE